MVVDHLGDGGTATVFLAWDEVDRSWCALKALQNKFLKDAEMRRRFDQEAEALRLLAHPHVPRLIHHAPDAVPPFMVIELARRGSAMDWVRKNGPMPATMASDVMFQVCEALGEAHAAGVVHRDVKPHNFLLDEQGVCKLTDFGIARISDNTSLTTTGSQIGTFSFMAPEQRSDTKSVDHRADIYSVGASLYTLLTAKTSAELFVADRDDELLTEVHPAFRDVVLKATRYRAEERYTSVIELQTDLMSALSRIPPTSDDFPPLAQPAAPLPDGPPEWLPADREFPDLDRSMGRTANSIPHTGDSDSDSNPKKKVIPYYMPERPMAPVMPAPRQGIPDYLDTAEVGDYRRRAEAEQRARLEAEVERTMSQEIALPVEPEEPDPVYRVVAVVGGLAAVVCTLLVGIVLAGMISVSSARGRTDAAGDALMQALQAEVAVVYEFRGDRRRFEEIYDRYRTATRVTDRLDAALEFVAALDRAVAAGSSMESSAEPKVRRLQAARDAYLSARDEWGDAAARFPGSAAVRSGLASPP